MNNINKTIKHFESLQKRYTTQHNGQMCERVADALEALYCFKNEEHCDHMAEVEYVIHAEWVKGKSGLYSCSHCDATCPYDVQGDVIEYWDCPRCPKCGAVMNI